MPGGVGVFAEGQGLIDLDHFRVSDTCRRICLLNNLPTGTRPSDVLAVSQVLRDRERRHIIDLSLSIGKLVAMAFSGGNSADAFDHLFTEKERKAQVEEDARKREKASQMALMTALKKWSDKLG